MDLLNLQGKLTLDTSEYEAAIQRAVNMGSGQFAGGMQTATGAAAQLQTSTTAAGVTTQQLGEQMQGAAQQTSSFGEMIKNAAVVTLGNLFTKAVLAAKDALVGFAKQSVSTGMGFDSAMSQVAATMGVTTNDIQELREFAEEMGATTAFSATQAAEALNYMALAGYDANKSMAMLPNVLNLAASGGMALGRASDMVTDAQSALGLSTEQTTEMVNKMAMAASKSNTSVEQLGDAILQIGGTAKKLKGGTTELATVLGILADNGMKGAEGGTHLRNMMNSLMSPTNKAKEMMSDLGISLYDAEGNMRSLNDVFLDMRAVMAEMTTQEERDKVVSTLFNTRDMKAAEALLAGVGQRYEELSGYIDQAAGSAEKMAGTQLDNLQGDITLFNSAVEGAQIAISERLTPALRKFTQFGSKAVSEMSLAFKSNGLTGAIEAAHKAISDSFGSKTTAAIFAAEAAIKAFAVGFAAIKAGDAIKGVASVFTNISTAINTATAATTAHATAEAAETAATVAGTAADEAATVAAAAEAVAEGEVTAAETTAATATAANTAAVTAQTSAQTAGVSAAAKFGAALSAVGMAASAAAVVGTAIASMINSYTDAMDEVGEPLKGLTDQEEEFAESVREASKALADSQKGWNSSVKDVEIQEKTTQKLVDRLYELNDTEEKTTEVKSEMAMIVNELNSSIEGLNIRYDQEAGLVQTARKEVEELTESYYKQAKAQAYKDIYSETVKKQTEAELALEEAQKMHDEKVKERIRNDEYLNDVKEHIKRVDEQIQKEKDLKGAYEQGSQAETNRINKIKELETEHDNLTATYKTMEQAQKDNAIALEDSTTTLDTAKMTYDDYTGKLQTVEDKMVGLTGSAANLAEAQTESLVATADATEALRNQIVQSEDGVITAYAQIKGQVHEFTEEQMTDIATLLDAYDEMYNAQYNAIEKSVDLYKGFTADTSVTYNDLYSNLQESAYYLNDWTTAIDQLQAKVDKGLMSQDFLDSLKSMGLDSWSIVYDMNHATGDQLKNYSDLWVQTNQGIKESTDKLMQGQKETTERQLNQITGIAGAKINNYKHSMELLGAAGPDGFVKGFNEKLKEAKAAAGEGADEVRDEWAEHDETNSPSRKYAELGLYAVQGFADGMVRAEGIAENAARYVAVKAYNAMVEELDIHSPSKKMRKLGGFTGEGFALGISDKEADVLNAAHGLAESAVDPLNNLTPIVSKGGANGAYSGAQGAETPTYVFNLVTPDGTIVGRWLAPFIDAEQGQMIAFSQRGYAT